MNREENKNLLFEKIELLKIPVNRRTKEQNDRIAEIQFILNEEARGSNSKEINDLDTQTQSMIDEVNGRIV